MRTIGGRTLVALTLAIGLVAAYASSVVAVDTLMPTAVAVTLQAGESTTVVKALHLDGLPAKADIIIAIDTTFSMSAALAAAKADAQQICLDVQAAIPGARFAAVEFQDYPISPYGASSDSPYELHTLGYTADCAEFSAGVALMTLGSGGDGPESNNRVHFEAYSDPALLASRDPQATRFLVMLADNVPHSMTAFGACPSTAPLSDPGRNGINESGAGDDIDTPEAINGLNADDHILLYVSYIPGPSPHACHEDLAEATGGVAVADEDAEDIGAFIIDQAEATPYTVDLEVSAGCQIGFAFSPSFPQGPFTGPQTIGFNETITAPTAVGNYTCTITAVMSPGGPTLAVETVNVTVTPGDPANVTLAPPNATNTVGDEHCVTATVTDEFGNPVAGVVVPFIVSGANPGGGAGVTDANGEAEFCYTGTFAGSDTITATAAGQTATAQKTWILPASAAGCTVTYGGRITAANGDRATFGGNAMNPGNGGRSPRGQQQYTDHGPAQPLNVHSNNVRALTCAATQATFFGDAAANGSPVMYRIDVKDLGTPGSGGDTYRIRLSNGYDSGEQPLEGGNIVIH